MHFTQLLLVVAACILPAFTSAASTSRDFKITYSQAKYGKGAKGTYNFCRAMRAQCVYWVGPKNFHHVLDCNRSQTGPTIYALCAGIKKLDNGDYGNGPPVDFTEALIKSGKLPGVKIVAKPKKPIPVYGTPAGSSAAAQSGVPSKTSAMEASPTMTSTDMTSTDTSPFSTETLS